MNARSNTFEFNCLGHEVNELVNAIFHSIIFYRCYGKFNYRLEGSYSIGTLGYEEIPCDFIDFTYVRCASPQLVENVNKDIKEFVDKLREDCNQSCGSISLEFYSRRRGRWPFNETPLVWEIWTVKINCDKDLNEKENKTRLEDNLFEKLLTIVQIVNNTKCFLPQMPILQYSDSIFETNYTEVQPYVFKISHKVGAAANITSKATHTSGDSSSPSSFAIKKFIKDTLAL